MITQRAKLNLIPGVVLPRLNIVQYDKGSRTLEFEIWNGQQRFTLTNQMTAKIQGTKPDRHGFDYSATVDTTNNIIVSNVTQQMTAAKGDAICEIVLNKGEERIGSLNFFLDIQPAALNDDTNISDSDIPEIIALATEQMLTAEAYAKGTREGVPVTSGQAGYHDNSKYYKDLAATSETNAANSATAAAGSATTATNKATEATNQALKSEGFAIGEQNGTPVTSGSPYYENNSKYYKDIAAGRATAAANSATLAHQEYLDAKNQADRAQQYADFIEPHFIIANNRLYIKNDAVGEFIVANNRMYMKLTA